MPNKLIHETSPYLLQHANNPVHWNAWGTEALELAKTEDKPILLSIGYSACHWCHVMEHESFENDSIAKLMNDNFINIKVDREERPDLDQIYMNAVQIMTGSGGWPLTLFLLPNTEPFYGGTYFPPDDRHGRPGFPRLLEAIAEAFRVRRDELKHNAQMLLNHLNEPPRDLGATAEVGLPLLEQAARSLGSKFDPREGGFGGAPKFPPSMALDFLMRYFHRSHDEKVLHMVNLTLEKMAGGGMYDHIGGGFHRYSVDDRWLVPHFEKMLYDNALLAHAYLDAYRLTKKPLYRRITEEILDFVVREMRAPDGGFYSTQDADSEGVEGKFYVWNLDEFKAVVGDDGDLLAQYFDVTRHGNWEHSNILNIPNAREDEDFHAKVEVARKKLYDAREKRIRPGRDEKILTDWNGLMLRAFAEAAAYLERDDYRRTAESNAEFILKSLWDGQRLLHNFKDGRARFNAYLDDYANFADGLFALYELTFDKKWLDHAVTMADLMIDRFWDSDRGGFYFTAVGHEELIARTKDNFDNATPSGNSVAADLLLRLSALLNRPDYRAKADAIFQLNANLVVQFPASFGRLLAALDFQIGPSQEVAIVGGMQPFASELRKHYLPRTVVAAGESNSIPLLQDRSTIDGKPTAYICRDFTCNQPVTEVSGFIQQLLV